MSDFTLKQPDGFFETELSRIMTHYPEEIQEIQQKVDETCDKLEYSGSPMFDEYPDLVQIEAITSHILQKLDLPPLLPPWSSDGAGGPFSPVSEKNEKNSPPSRELPELIASSFPPCHGRNCPPPGPPFPPSCPYGNCTPIFPDRPCGHGKNCPPPRPDYGHDGRPDWRKHLVSVLLWREMENRRRRYRNRNWLR